jgi:hypothetical protein
MSKPSDYSVGQSVTFLAGPTRVKVTAEVIGHEGQFILTQDDKGKVRKTRPGAITS